MSSEDHNGGKRIRRPFQGRVSPTEEDKLLLKEISKPSRISYVSEKRRNPFLAAEDDTNNPFLDPDNEAENPFLAPDDKLALTGHQGAHRAGSAGHEENPESRSPGGTGDNKQLLEPTQPVDDPDSPEKTDENKGIMRIVFAVLIPVLISVTVGAVVYFYVLRP